MTASVNLFEHCITLANTPVSPGNYAGGDIRYSAGFEALENELEKAAAMHQTDAVDWQKVRDLSEGLLREQSKDLRVAAWLTWSLHQREGLPGLHAGLGLLLTMCEQSWAQLHPNKYRTRAAAFAWLTPRLEKAFGDDTYVASQIPLFRNLSELLHKLEACLTEQLGELAPLLLPLCRRIDEQLARAEHTLSSKDLTDIPHAEAKQATSHSLLPAALLDNERDAHKSLRALQDSARTLCAWWLKQKTSDVRALRLSRTLLWLPIDSLPECDAEQITALRGLPTDKLSSFSERFANGLFADLLVELEPSLARSPFWLDGQRMAWQCLQEVGAEPAMREVEIQLALFLQRVPGLEDLRFHDGTPFADANTRAWLASDVMPHLQTPAPEPQPPSNTDGGNAPAWEIALQAALPQLRKEGLKCAVQQLKQGMTQALGGRARFFWQLALARLCNAAKKHELARTQLESLDHSLQANNLSDWEPGLALEVLRQLHACYELLPQSHVVRERKEEIYRRLCHLDLEAVLD